MERVTALDLEKTMFRLILSVFILLANWGAPAYGDPPQLDPELNLPYRLHVVLHVAKHRLLTPIFRDQVERELGDSIQAALGDLALVTVVQKHPRLEAVETEGLDRALNGWKEISETKTHFVLIDFVNGRYEVQARQFDGLTGLPSPVVRRKVTADRRLVARTAALLLDLDFGLVGTVTKVKDNDVAVTLKGGGLGAPIDRWLKKGDVFAIAEIASRGASAPGVRRLQSSRVRGALLQVAEDPKDGGCHCLLFNRYKEPLAGGPGILGYRCLKLGTAETPLPLRFRVVAERKGTPQNGLTVKVRSAGAQGQDGKSLSTLPDGTTDPTKESYRNMALVQVQDLGRQWTGDVPVEIVDDRTITIEVNPQPGGDLYLWRDRWVKQIYEAIEVADSLVRQINEIYKQDPNKALDMAKAGLQTMEKVVSSLMEEPTTRRVEAERLKIKLDLTDGEERLHDLGVRREEFRDYVKKLETSIAKQTDPTHQAWTQMALQAQGLEGEDQYGEAIELYQKIIAEGAKEEKLRAHLDHLKAQWKVKDARHQKARDFIYRTWAKLTRAADMKANLAQARESFEICRAAGDVLTPQKLRRANVALTAHLAKELELLRPDRDDDRPALETIDRVSVDLKKLDDDVKDYLRQFKPAEK
jgi:hypothetical protein